MDNAEVPSSISQRLGAVPGDGRIVLQSQRLKALRKVRGWSQASLAEFCLDQRLCISLASIKRAETGKSVLYRTARQLAVAYKVEFETLLLPTVMDPAHKREQERAFLLEALARFDGDELLDFVRRALGTMLI